MIMSGAMFAYNIPSQVCRENFGFFSWRDFDSEIWQDIKSSAKVRIKHNGEFAFKIIGYEADEHNVKAGIQNVKKAMLDKYIDIQKGDYSDIMLPSGPTTAVVNAPKIDVFKKEDSKETIDMLSKLVKKTFKGEKTWIISDNTELDKLIGVQHTKECEVKNGKFPFILGMY